MKATGAELVSRPLRHEKGITVPDDVMALDLSAISTTVCVSRADNGRCLPKRHCRQATTGA